MGGMFSKPKVQTNASGLNSTPQVYQNLYNAVGGNITSALPQINANMFDPSQGYTSGAFSNIMQGFAPTADTLSSDMSMLENPYNQSVINLMNREAQGQNSILNQALNRTGQMGSNRSILGANDIEQNRLNNIGQFQQQQYNTNLSQLLNNIIPQRQSDAMTQLGVGSQANQAPFQALMAQGDLLAALPGMQNSQAARSSGGGFDWGKAFQTGGAIMSMFSDERLKENIQKVGTQNGINIYHFNYAKNHPFLEGKGIDTTKRYSGVMAQEIKDILPKAVAEYDGYMAVDYAMIGVKFKEVA